MKENPDKCNTANSKYATKYSESTSHPQEPRNKTGMEISGGMYGCQGDTDKHKALGSIWAKALEGGGHYQPVARPPWLLAHNFDSLHVFT